MHASLFLCTTSGENNLKTTLRPPCRLSARLAADLWCDMLRNIPHSRNFLEEVVSGLQVSSAPHCRIRPFTRCLTSRLSACCAMGLQLDSERAMSSRTHLDDDQISYLPLPMPLHWRARQAKPSELTGTPQKLERSPQCATQQRPDYCYFMLLPKRCFARWAASLPTPVELHAAPSCHGTENP